MILRQSLIALILFGSMVCFADNLTRLNQTTILQDDFIDNRNNWTPYENETVRLEIGDGRFLFTIKTDDGSWMQWQSISLSGEEDYRIEIDIQHLSGIENNSMGVIFGTMDASNYIEFCISANGYYRLGKSENATYTPIVPWTLSSAINPGNSLNTISVEKLGSQMQLFINGIAMTTIQAPYWFGNSIGLIVRDKQTVAFERLLVQAFNLEPPPLNENIIVLEDFDTNLNNWIISGPESEEAVLAMINGSYFFKCKLEDGNWMSWNNLLTYQLFDYSVSSTMQYIRGDVNNYGFGMAWGLKDANNYNRLLITANGYYTFDIISEGNEIFSTHWIYHTAIKRYASNSISYKQFGRYGYIYINGILIQRVRTAEWFGNKTGFVVFRQQEIRFDNIAIVSLTERDLSAEYEKKPKIQQTSFDTEPPLITINEPAVTRGMKVANASKSLSIKGTVYDQSGVVQVTVNGTDAYLGENGEFWADVMLAVGENSIDVRAMDTKMNTAEQSFTILREAAKMPLQTNLTQPGGMRLEGTYHALIIAVEDYNDPVINKLDYPVRDASSLQTMLTTYYTFESKYVTFLINPKREDIINAFDHLAQKLYENDNLLIFYAGHGYWDENIKQGFWLPADARRTSRAQWLSNSTIRDYIGGMRTKHTLLIADACFSGGIFKTRAAFSEAPKSVQELYKLPSRKAITSGAMKEVPDKSVFVEFLTKRLRENAEQFLNSESLFSSFREAVINNSPNGQVPQYGEIKETGDEGGDFIFVKR